MSIYWSSRMKEPLVEEVSRCVGYSAVSSVQSCFAAALGCFASGSCIETASTMAIKNSEKAFHLLHLNFDLKDMKGEHACVCECVCVHMCVCVCACLPACARACLCVCMCAHACVCMCVLFKRRYKEVCTGYIITPLQVPRGRPGSLYYAAV